MRAPASEGCSGHKVAGVDGDDCPTQTRGDGHSRVPAALIPPWYPNQMPLGSHSGCSGSVGSDILVSVVSETQHHAGGLLLCSHPSYPEHPSPSLPTISSLSHPAWISLSASQLCLCSHSKHPPSGAESSCPLTLLTSGVIAPGT